jgi:sugar lactone lactonase YvrE
MEIKSDGTKNPYPNTEWNTWNGQPEKNHFTCVQSVYAHGGHLYVLDPSSPEMKGVVGKAKLFRFNLTTDQLDRTWEFDESVAPKKSYLNDLRIDEKSGVIFITDSGLGGIVALDMKSGETKRLLDKHPSTKSENVKLIVDKKVFAQKIHSDGIALSPLDNKLYYHAVTGYNLYRVPASLLDPGLKDETQLVKKVERLGITPAPDGMIFDNLGNLYMADLERNAVSYRTPRGDIRILIQDERIKWPDTLTIDGQNNLIFTDSLLQDAEIGKPVDEMTFKVYRVRLPGAEGVN